MTALSKDKSQKLETLKESLWLYNEASSMIAHSTFTGLECEKVLLVLQFLQRLRKGLESDITAIQPDAFETSKDADETVTEDV